MGKGRAGRPRSAKRSRASLGGSREGTKVKTGSGRTLVHSRKDSRPPRGSCGRPHRSKRCGAGDGYPNRGKRVAGAIRVWAAARLRGEARARARVRGGGELACRDCCFFSRSEFACPDARVSSRLPPNLTLMVRVALSFMCVPSPPVSSVRSRLNMFALDFSRCASGRYRLGSAPAPKGYHGVLLGEGFLVNVSLSLSTASSTRTIGGRGPPLLA